MRLRRFSSILVGLMAAAGMVATPAAPASAVAGPPVFDPLTSTSLPSGFKAIEVDGTTKRVFVSAPLSSVVTVLGYDAEVQGSLAVPGAGALLLDGATIYVASTTAGRIDAFNAATLAPAGTFGGGALVKPNALVKAGGKLWTTSGSCGGGDQLVSIEPTTGALTTHPVLPDLSSCPFLFTSPTEPNVVFGFNDNGSGTAVVRLDVSGAAPVLAAAVSTGTYNIKDADVLPDGQTFAFSSSWPYEVRTFRTNPLEPFGVVYPAGAYPNAVEATAGAGGLVAVGRDGAYDPDIYVYRTGDPSQNFLTHDFGATSNTLKAAGLAFTPDGSRLFAVSGNWGTESSTLTVFGRPGEGGSYHPLTPARILDTRNGDAGGRLGPGATAGVQVTGRGGVPAGGVAAVAMNVTVTQPTATSFLTLFPAGGGRPLASNLNFTAGKTVANLVVVKVGAGGMVSMFNAVGSADVIFDVAGWYSHTAAEREDSGRYTPLLPSRILDTRDGGVRLGPGSSVDLQVAGAGGVPASGALAAVLNVAATGTTATSFVTVHPTGQPRPLASNLNFDAGQTVSNRAMVMLGTGGKVTIYNLAGSTDIVVDVGGWYSDASAAPATGGYTALSPTRILDTRDGPSGPLAGGTAMSVQITGRAGVPASGVSAVVLNATVVGPEGPGFLTVFPRGGNLPLASDVNYAAGEIRPNLVVVRVGADGTIVVYTSTTAHVVLDVAGWMS